MVYGKGFKGRVVMVTGSSKPDGIGFHTAGIMGLAGAGVALASYSKRVHDRAEDLREMGVDAFSAAVDLTRSEDTNAMVKEVLARFGKIDVLVNNAGMGVADNTEISLEFMDLSEAQWDQSIRNNLKTAFNATKAVLPGMIEQCYGRIVNVSSVTGPLVSNIGDSPYSAAKAG
ncbi:MAG: SDR family NAD(P)-dependent oxidoreductase, partial [Desulfobacterales bacterium]|nr:SDR family NAD(P)-dependent oxidoreductase [Desulfobacterales bacterium]